MLQPIGRSVKVQESSAARLPAAQLARLAELMEVLESKRRVLN
jgi:hypothetical protein